MHGRDGAKSECALMPDRRGAQTTRIGAQCATTSRTILEPYSNRKRAPRGRNAPGTMSIGVLMTLPDARQRRYAYKTVRGAV